MAMVNGGCSVSGRALWIRIKFGIKLNLVTFEIDQCHSLLWDDIVVGNNIIIYAHCVKDTLLSIAQNDQNQCTPVMILVDGWQPMIQLYYINII